MDVVWSQAEKSLTWTDFLNLLPGSFFLHLTPPTFAFFPHPLKSHPPNPFWFFTENWVSVPAAFHPSPGSVALALGYGLGTCFPASELAKQNVTLSFYKPKVYLEVNEQVVAVFASLYPSFKEKRWMCSLSQSVQIILNSQLNILHTEQCFFHATCMEHEHLAAFN